MPDIRDTLDAVLIGAFLFGLLLTVATVLLGVADIGMDDGSGQDASPIPFGLGALLVFITWWGGVGFILRRSLEWPVALALPVAALVGVAAGWLIQRAVRLLSRGQGSVLEPERYRLPGALGLVNASILPGGTGEVLYERGGTRHVVTARTADGVPLPTGVEVMIVSVEDGIALVERFDPYQDRNETGGQLRPP